MIIENIVLYNMDANTALRLALQGLDKTKIGTSLHLKGRKQVDNWCAPVSDTTTGQPNPLWRADELIASTQQENYQSALTLIAWLIVQLIKRTLKPLAGSAQILLATQQVFADLQSTILRVLAESERDKER